MTGWSASAPTRCATSSVDSKVYDALAEHLGVGHNETTPDGTITLEHAECLAACDYGPVMTVNYEFFDKVDPDSAVGVVDQLARARGRKPSAGRAAVHAQGDVAAARRLRRRAAPTRSPTASPATRPCAGCGWPRSTASAWPTSPGGDQPGAVTRYADRQADGRPGADRGPGGATSRPATASRPATHRCRRRRSSRRQAHDGSVPRGAGQAHPGADPTLGRRPTRGSARPTSGSTGTARCARRWPRTRTS